MPAAINAIGATCASRFVMFVHVMKFFTVTDRTKIITAIAPIMTKSCLFLCPNNLILFNTFVPLSFHC